MFRISAALLLKGVVIGIYGYSQLKSYRLKNIDFKLKETSVITDSCFYSLSDTCPGPDNPFPAAVKLSHALAHRTELIISRNLLIAPLFFPFKRIILRTLTRRISFKSFSSGMCTCSSGSRSTIFQKENLEAALNEGRI